MSDEFIGSLKADWNPQGADVALVRLRRRRWAPHALLAADAFGALVMLGFGLAYGVIALERRDLLFALSAVAMLPVGLPLVLAGMAMRWRALAWEGETPEGVLTSSLRRLIATRRVLKLGRSAAVVLFLLAIAIWGSALAGWVREPRWILLVITSSWVTAALAGLGWIRWRLARTARDIAACESLLDQFRDLAA